MPCVCVSVQVRALERDLEDERDDARVLTDKHKTEVNRLRGERESMRKDSVTVSEDLMTRLKNACEQRDEAREQVRVNAAALFAMNRCKKCWSKRITTKIAEVDNTHSRSACELRDEVFNPVLFAMNRWNKCRIRNRFAGVEDTQVHNTALMAAMDRYILFWVVFPCPTS